MTNPLNVISANHLRSGLNVYYVQNGADSFWDTDIAKASVYDDDSQTENMLALAFEQAKQDMANNIVIDCTIVPVDRNHIPLTTRERIRASGPSSRYGHAAKSQA
ncbi:MAG: DUF2849 domain-containing protein [Alphaproteobacteria bacterium]|nr:DUF2849 domain-containing protein [Alphaproteobacteria bacterium]